MGPQKQKYIHTHMEGATTAQTNNWHWLRGIIRLCIDTYVRRRTNDARARTKSKQLE